MAYYLLKKVCYCFVMDFFCKIVNENKIYFSLQLNKSGSSLSTWTFIVGFWVDRWWALRFATKSYIPSTVNKWIILWQAKYSLMCCKMLNHGLNIFFFFLVGMYFELTQIDFYICQNLRIYWCTSYSGRNQPFFICPNGSAKHRLLNVYSAWDV